MAKALYGQVATGQHAHLVTEVMRLRERIAELEAQTVRQQAENDRLLAALAGETMVMTSDPELAAQP